MPYDPWRDPIQVTFENHLRQVAVLLKENHLDGPEREQSIYRPLMQIFSYMCLALSTNLTSADQGIPRFLSVCPQGPVYAHYPSVSASAIPTLPESERTPFV